MAQVQAVTFAVIVGLMLAETRRSRLNEAALAAAGALRPDGDVWVWMAAIYPLSFVVMTAEGIWRALYQPVEMADRWYVAGLVCFAAAKAIKYWAIATLGDRWSFRVIVQPGRPLIRSGPYRFVAHPNYVGVAGELVGTAMMMTAAVTGPLMNVAFAVVLWGRIRFEERTLRSVAP
jgi:methyltransferase